MTKDLQSLSLIWTDKYKSNDQREIDLMIFEMESERNELHESLHEQSIYAEWLQLSATKLSTD